MWADLELGGGKNPRALCEKQKYAAVHTLSYTGVFDTAMSRVYPQVAALSPLAAKARE